MIQLPIWGLQGLGFVIKHRRAFASVGAALIIASLVTYAWHRADAYFDGISQTRTDLANAQREARDLTGRMIVLGNTLDENRRTFDLEREQLAAARRVAEQERDAAVARADHYRSIRDAALSSPPEDRSPVSPVVADTIGRLWPEDPAG